MEQNKDNKIPEEPKKEIEKPVENKQNPPQEETQEQINWRKFRESREKERLEKEKELEEQKNKAKQAEEQAKAFKEALDAMMANDKPQAQEASIPSSFDLEAIDMPTGKEIKEYTQKSINEGIQKGLEKYLAEQQRVQQEREKQDLPKRIRGAHKDFDEVCSQENLDYLEYHYPEITSAFSHMPDSLDKWTNVYKAVKKFVPNINSNPDKAKADKNLNKPQSVSSVSTESGQNFSKGLPQSRRDQNWERMQKIMKGL
jgi:hypothetical protein